MSYIRPWSTTLATLSRFAVLPLTLALVLLTGCDGDQTLLADEPAQTLTDDTQRDTDTADEPVDPSRLPDDDGLAVNADVLEDVRLENGTRVLFVSTGNGVGVYEQLPPGAPSLEAFPALRSAPLIDVFLAVTEPGTPVPMEIEAVSKPSASVGEQGWLHQQLRDAPLTLAAGGGYCNNANFSNAVSSKGYNDRGTPKLRLNKLVGSTGYFKEHTECFGTGWVGGCPKFYRYEVGGNNGSVFSNVDKYYTRVALCGLGNHPTITSNYGTNWSHPGPLLEVAYRDNNNNGYFNVIHEDFAPNDVGGAWAWHYWGGTGHWNYDWRTRITLAKKNDYFDIGHAVEDLGY